MAQHYPSRPYGYEYLAFTVKYNRKAASAITEKDYEPFFKRLFSYGKNVFKIAELDKKKRLHYHGVVALPIGFYKRKFMISGFHWKFTLCWNFCNWMSYCFKNYNYDEYDDTISLICTENITIVEKKETKKEYKKRILKIAEENYLLQRASNCLQIHNAQILQKINKKKK